MVDVNLKVPALEKLLDYAASGIGAVAGPMLATWRARQDAKAKLIGVQAEADSLRLIADAQADARQSLVEPDQAGPGMVEIGPDGIAQRIEFQEKKRQANIVSVVQDAAAELGGKEVSDREPDPDWTARFFDCVQDISSENMRKLWAKVLSGEVEEPGRTSLRTLDVLKNMTQRDAQTFESICDFVIDDFIYYPTEYQTNHLNLRLNNMIHLQNIGLVYFSSFLSKTLEFVPNRKQFIFRYQDTFLRITTKDDSKRVKISVILLTSSGMELYRILKCTVHMGYLQSFSRFLTAENCELSYAHIVQTVPDSGFSYATHFTPIEPQPENLGGAAS